MRKRVRELARNLGCSGSYSSIGAGNGADAVFDCRDGSHIDHAAKPVIGSTA